MDKQSYYCVRFYVTHSCNSNCVFCDTHDSRYRRIKPMKKQEAMLLIDRLFAAGCRYIDFTGGEPTLCTHLPELISHAKSLGIKTEVTTNGVCGLTEDGSLQPVLKSCAELADKFNISLDTLDPKAYARIRGVDCLDKVLSVIKQLSWCNPKLMMVITPDNAGQLESLLKFAAENNCRLYVNPLFTYSDGEKDSCASDCLDMLQNCFFVPSAVIMLHFIEFYRDTCGFPTVPCSANRQTLTVAANGDLFLPCYHAVNREQLSVSGSLEKALSSPEFLYFSQHSGKLPDCKNCTVTPYFGISFSYRLDRYSLLQNISEKISHLKKLTDPHSGLLRYNSGLNSHLKEFLQIVRSLDIEPSKEENELYSARIHDNGTIVAEVYREPLSREEYEQDFSAPDVWSLTRMPHHYFDFVKATVFETADKCLTSGYHTELASAVLENANEFAIRWWKLYVSSHMNVKITCDIKAESQWLKNYITDTVCRFCKAACINPPELPDEITMF